MSCIRTSLPGSSGGIKLRGLWNRQGKLVFSCVLLLSACSPSPSPNNVGAPPPPAASTASPSSSTAPSPNAAAGSATDAGATINMGAPVTGTDALAAPPDAGDRPPLPGQSGNPLMPNGLPALQPHGVDLQKLFSEDIKDPVERIKRVENAVVEMRRDFDAVLPSIVRLVAVEQDMQDLTKQLGVLLQNEPQASSAANPSGAGVEAIPRSPPDAVASNGVPAPAVAQPPPQPVQPLSPAISMPASAPPSTAPPRAQPVAPVEVAAAPAVAPLQAPPETPPQPVPKPAATPPPPPMSSPMPLSTQTATSTAPPTPLSIPPPASAPVTDVGEPARKPLPAGKAVSEGPSVQAIRFGEHSGTTRIVMEVTGKPSYRKDLDNDEKLLVIELPGTAWKAAAKQFFATNPTVASYTTQTLDTGGTRLILQLKDATKVVYETTLAAEGTAPRRIVLDLKK